MANPKFLKTGEGSPDKLSNRYLGLVLRVAIPSPLRTHFDYLPPRGNLSQMASLMPGSRVIVPFGRRQILGFILEHSNASNIELTRLKVITRTLDEKPTITPTLLKTLICASEYYQHPIGEVLLAAIPSELRSPRLKSKQSYIWKAQDNAKAYSDLQRKPRQMALLDLIRTETTGMQAKDLKAQGFDYALLLKLESSGLLKREPLLDPADPSKFLMVKKETVLDANVTLNSEQKAALKSINSSQNNFATFLLDGVTGSGKTEVYLEAISRQIKLGFQCLFLVPEIGLTPQTFDRFNKRFKCPIIMYHSNLSAKQKLMAWSQACDESPLIVIGTRSSVFLPMPSLSLIVIDEEHDSSYKQQDGFRYSARDFAVMRAHNESFTIILGSATPSLESLHNTIIGKSTRLQLTRPATEAPPNTTHIVDINSICLQEGFSKPVLDRISEHLLLQNQILIFINRRGFAPVLLCNACGWTSECDSCVSRMTVHSKPAKLRCHHCGTNRSIPTKCQNCSSTKLETFGLGTQKIEDFLTHRFPSIPKIRIDRDTTRGNFNLNQKLSEISSGRPCLLIGTQMLSKGHHFPNISLVVVLDADAGLFSSDFRGQEQMTQTLIQVSGRAGRGINSGEVIIQSRHPNHETLNLIASRSFKKLAQLQLLERQNTELPPFAHLCLLRGESKYLKDAYEFLNSILALSNNLKLANKHDIVRIGPIQAPREKKAGRFRVHLILKSKTRALLQNHLKEVIALVFERGIPRKVRFHVDVDPIEML